MKKIKTIISIALAISCVLLPAVLCGCKKNKGQSTAYSAQTVTQFNDKFSQAQTYFFTRLTEVYANDANYNMAYSLSQTIASVCESVATVNSNYSQFQLLQSSVEDQEILTSIDYGFKYAYKTDEFQLMCNGTNLKFSTKTQTKSFELQVVCLAENNYAFSLFSSEESSTKTTSTKAYFNGSIGRVSIQENALDATQSIFEITDFSTFAQEGNTGYYFEVR